MKKSGPGQYQKVGIGYVHNELFNLLQPSLASDEAPVNSLDHQQRDSNQITNLKSVVFMEIVTNSLSIPSGVILEAIASAK